jgi:hypothetical protein
MELEMTYFRNKYFTAIFSVFISITVCIAVKLFLSFSGSKDDNFFFYILCGALLFSIVISPGFNIFYGLRRLFLFDWLASIIVAFCIGFGGPEKNFPAVVISFCFFTLLLSVGIFVRRFRGKG